MVPIAHRSTEPNANVHGARGLDNLRHAPVAQLDRAAGYEPAGREFESLRARQDDARLVDSEESENSRPARRHKYVPAPSRRYVRTVPIWNPGELPWDPAIHGPDVVERVAHESAVRSAERPRRTWGGGRR